MNRPSRKRKTKISQTQQAEKAKEKSNKKQKTRTSRRKETAQFDSKKVHIGENDFVWGKSLLEMPDSTADFKDNRWTALRGRMKREGFVFVRNVVDKETVKKARLKVLKYAKEVGIIKPKDFMMAPIGKSNGGYAVDALTGGAAGSVDNDVSVWSEIGNSKELTDIYNGKDIKAFLGNLFNRPIQMLPEQTWIRLMPRNGNTVEHADYYYFRKDTQILEHKFLDEKNDNRDEKSTIEERESSNGSEEKPKFVVKAKKTSLECEKCTKPATRGYRDCTLCGGKYHIRCMSAPERNLVRTPHFWSAGGWQCSSCADSNLDFYTIWVCLSEIQPDGSALAVCPKTKTLRGFNLPPKNQQLPRDYKKTADPWVIPSQLRPGDIIAFNIKTIHASSLNTTDFYRLSVDTRFYVKEKEGLQMSISACPE